MSVKKVLLVGGTGTISRSFSRYLLGQGHDLYLLNRGRRTEDIPAAAKLLQADIADDKAVYALLKDKYFDAVVDFICYGENDAQRSYGYFKDKTDQYIFISSASAYQKPPLSFPTSEDTPLVNPFWQYSRDKIACEEFFLHKYEVKAFPVTLVRPSHTYDERKIPLGVYGQIGSWQVIERIMSEKPVLIHGDGSSLWTMTHSRDLAPALTGLLGKKEALGEAYHITSDEALTWNQIYETLAALLGKKLNPFYVASKTLADLAYYDLTGPLLGDKANNSVFDNSKIKRLVPDFEAKISFKKGLAESLDFYFANPDYQISDLHFDKWCDNIVEEIKSLAQVIK